MWWLLAPRTCCCHRSVACKPRYYSNHRTDSSPRVDSRAFWNQVARCGMEAGTSFNNFKDTEAALKKLKNEQYHPLRVYNSQSAADYNRKRVNAKNLSSPVDTEQIRYTYYSVRCVQYDDPRQSQGKGMCPNQCSLSKGCQAKVALTYDR